MKLYEIGDRDGLTAFVIADNEIEATSMAYAHGITRPRKIVKLPLRGKRVIVVTNRKATNGQAISDTSNLMGEQEDRRHA